MPVFERDATRIHYEVHGEGFPVLMLAPGGMRSSIPVWDQVPWNPIETLSSKYRVIAMDQRNAGQSTAPVTATDGWRDYTSSAFTPRECVSADRLSWAWSRRCRTASCRA